MLLAQVHQRILVRALLGSTVLLLLVSGIAIGLLIRQLTADAAPNGTIEACVSRYTGAVRMNPYGTTTCSSSETKVTWSVSDTHGVGETLRVEENLTIPPKTTSAAEARCPSGYVATGGGFVSNGWTSIIFMDSIRTDDGAGWYIAANNTEESPRIVGVNVVCARP